MLRIKTPNTATLEIGSPSAKSRVGIPRETNRYRGFLLFRRIRYQNIYSFTKSSAHKILGYLCFMLLLFLSGCGPHDAQKRGTASPSLRSLQTPIASSAWLTPTPLPTHWIAATRMAASTHVKATSTPIAIPTMTPTVVVIQKHFLPVQTDLPPGTELAGYLILGGFSKIFRLDLHTGNKQILTEDIRAAYNWSVSPNGRLLAYQTGYDENGTIVIESADGKHQQRILWGQPTRFKIVGWIDNNYLSLFQTTDSQNEIHQTNLAFNISSGERVEIPFADYPLFCACASAGNLIFYSSPQAIDPSQELVVYPRLSAPDEDLGEYYSLWDRQNKRELAKLRTYMGFRSLDPLWSPDGQFVLVSPTVKEGLAEWFSVNRSGEVRQLTHFGDAYPHAMIGHASLSPNGQLLAFWLDSGSGQSLSILDIGTGMVTDYGIPGSDDNYSQAPIWSPDGRYLATENYYAANSRFTILTDLRDGWAAQLTNGTRPIGWLASP